MPNDNEIHPPSSTTSTTPASAPGTVPILRRGLERKSRTTLITFVAILFLFLAINVHMVAPYLLAVVMGGILAILCEKPYEWLRSRNLGPKSAAGILTFGVVVLVVGPLTSFGIVAVKQAIAFGQNLANKESFSFSGILARLSSWGPVQAIVGNPEQLEQQIRNTAQSLGKSATGMVVALASTLPEILLQLALAGMACFFLIIDGKKLLRYLSNKIPLDKDVRINLIDSFHETTFSVIWATLAAAGAQAAMMFIAFLTLGIPGAVLAGGATFVFAWIPILGSTPAWLAGAIYLYLQGSLLKVGIMIAIGLFTSILDNFVRSWVLKGRNDMHPLLSLIAIFGGINLFGIFGVFYGPILAAILLSLLEIWPDVAVRFGLMNPHPGNHSVKSPTPARDTGQTRTS